MRYGADNLFKRLRAVLLAKPVYYDIVTPINPWQEKWVGKVDKKLALEQHQDMADALKGEKVECHFLKPVKGATEQKDCRDAGLISSKGAIVATQKHAIKRGEAVAFKEFCNENQIPILNEGIEIKFEGGDFFFIDESTCLLGIGPRTQVSAKVIQKLLDQSVQFVRHKSPHHLGSVFNVISKDLVVCNQEYLDGPFLYLKDKQVIPVSDIESMPTNFLLIEENKILADSGCREFNKRLEKEGVEVVEVDVSELKKNGGSIRCMTLPILRE